MPVRQQYFIASAIIALIIVMILFAAFDYFSDRSRLAEQASIPSRGAVSLAAGMPYVGAVTPAGVIRNPVCFSCGWRGPCRAGGQCPNCFAFMGYPNLGAFPADAQNAAFLWPQGRADSPAQLTGALYCPACDFVMSCRHRVAPNSVACPRCSAYLVCPNQAGGGRGDQPFGQQAAFVPGQGLGPGQGMSPYCPLR
ncbi:MAG TPA: hypothetical protein HPP77_08240 [Candidatus Hydrogenedentes bacterium]|nr:hypothetical protein [Candidatus Hydrogenedentota bacterium]HIJ74281.1 hypothetical protein [Candidatus Hydrogenedentota bacterium]